MRYKKGFELLSDFDQHWHQEMLLSSRFICGYLNAWKIQ